MYIHAQTHACIYTTAVVFQSSSSSLRIQNLLNFSIENTGRDLTLNRSIRNSLSMETPVPVSFPQREVRCIWCQSRHLAAPPSRALQSGSSARRARFVGKEIKNKNTRFVSVCQPKRYNRVIGRQTEYKSTPNQTEVGPYIIYRALRISGDL